MKRSVDGLRPAPALARLASSLAVVAALCLAPSLQGQSCPVGPPTQLGTVTLLPSTCPSGPGNLPGTTCLLLRVECDGLPSIDVQLRIIDPDVGVAERGTVVMGLGGLGTGFYSENVGGETLMQDLLAQGFRVVDRAWVSGWFVDGLSIRKQSCRYATLLTWVHDNIHNTGAFCATGNSGASGELGYALTTWGCGDILDVAVPTGGPPMTRLDFGCPSPSSAAWAQQCAATLPAHVMECSPAECSIPPGHPFCQGCTASATLQDLREDSILHPAAVLNYPGTRVHVVVGAQDCLTAVFAMLFHDAVTSEKVMEFVQGTPHWVATTQEGRDAILRAVLGGAACVPTPATLAWQAWPQTGGTLDLDLRGPAGGTYLLVVSASTGMADFGSLGWLFLAPPLFILGSGPLDPVTGIGTVSLPVPANAALVGVEVYLQALVGPSCLTNLARVVIV